MLNISESVPDRDIITIEYSWELTHALLNNVISNDLSELY